MSAEASGTSARRVAYEYQRRAVQSLYLACESSFRTGFLRIRFSARIFHSLLQILGLES